MPRSHKFSILYMYITDLKKNRPKEKQTRINQSLMCEMNDSIKQVNNQSINQSSILWTCRPIIEDIINWSYDWTIELAETQYNFIGKAIKGL